MKKIKEQPEKNVKPLKYACIGLVIAPDVPCTELKALKTHFKEAMKDPEYSLVTNYEVRPCCEEVLTDQEAVLHLCELRNARGCPNPHFGQHHSLNHRLKN